METFQIPRRGVTEYFGHSLCRAVFNQQKLDFAIHFFLLYWEALFAGPVKFISERNDSPYVVRDSSAVITVKKGILLKACATASVRMLLVLMIDYYTPRDMFYKISPASPHVKIGRAYK